MDYSDWRTASEIEEAVATAQAEISMARAALDRATAELAQVLRVLPVKRKQVRAAA